MLITVCYLDDNFDGIFDSVNVTIEEGQYYGHGVDCVIDWDAHNASNDGNHHGNWQCEFDATVEAFIPHFMNNFLNLFGNNSDCKDYAYNIIKSTYIKDLCVIPCYEENFGEPGIVRLEQCGDSVACCRRVEKWCKDDEGNVVSSFVSQVQTGECSDGTSNCRSKGSFIFEGSACSPRSCSSN